MLLMAQQKKEYMSAREVADLLGFNVQTVTRRAQELRGVKVLGRWRFKRTDIEAYYEQLKSQEREGGEA